MNVLHAEKQAEIPLKMKIDSKILAIEISFEFPILHSHITIAWQTFYVNNGDFTIFCAGYFNSFYENEFRQKSYKTDGQKMKGEYTYFEY